MTRISWLDRIVYRFQHRWETSPQYRAVVSGVVGLCVILTMCSCMGLLNQTASSALAAIGLGGASAAQAQGTPNTGTNQLTGYQSIPTPTVLYPTGNAIPIGTIADSQTPPPYATATDTPPPATATDTPTSGGGGGGGSASCNGGSGSVTWSFSPCPAVHGQSVTFTLHAPNQPGHQMQFEVGFGMCSDGCAWVYSPTTIGSDGYWSHTGTIPNDASGPVTGNFSVNGGPSGIILGKNIA
ncbi:MAG: hypothetical protein ACHQ4H_10195 [Ktedonobacterales bacterium]